MFRCNAGEMLSFEKGAIWQDLCAELDEWEKQILSDLAEPTYNPMQDTMKFSKDERVLYDEYLRGCLLTVGRVKRLPLMIAQMLEENNQEQPSTISEDSDE